MAKQTVTRLIDDIDQGPADESVSFGLDGVLYDIDLSEVHAKELRAVLAPYIEAGRKVTGRIGTFRTRVPAATNAARRHDNQAIRKWAADHGIPLKDRGRIPADVVEKYQAA
jgi:hypothetical protein